MFNQKFTETKKRESRRSLLIAAALCAAVFPTVAVGQEAPEVPQVEIRASMMPYFDHSQASIGLEKGWFDEVGITFLPDGKGTMLTSADQAMGIAAAGTQDVMAGLPQLFMPGFNNLPKMQLFSLGAYFKGFAIMAQPDAGYRSYAEFIADGLAPEEALQQSIAQMRGKSFAYPAEAAIKGFIDLALERGGVSLDEMSTVVAPDAETTRLMESDRADFQVGGVPSRLTLQVNGYKPIVTSGDLASAASPSADSDDLRAVLYAGWMATDEWIENNRDTALRMVSVSMRINQLIKDDPSEALAIHVPYLNSAAGTDFDTATGEVVYRDLNPYLTFEEQKAVFDDPDNALNIEYVTGSAIKLYEEQGIFEVGQYSWKDFVVADDLYHELERLKAEADDLLERIEVASANADEAAKQQAAELTSKANAFYDAFDFLDAVAYAKAALDGLGG
ncbi:hypothetical protein O9Z70_03190 [Devosia sp. YIM 151766]|uniref:ABC transporter substrate-binding protein n=1 Tax=Devosia sp. YIM 151766 TaxID=3017325 RepID=UPI00255C9699|nr:hypothetical protein [Devosia sp. YIM 151766]WIY53558.1 hypothetical protein O9Z70_03190 [Devosia sp. YIM 151766]